jgi:hypothetical protein
MQVLTKMPCSIEYGTMILSKAESKNIKLSFAICSAHFSEEHEGSWQDCKKCPEGVETEMHVYYGTNEYNFEKLANPPKYKPTRCTKCDRVIRLGYDGYSYGSDGYTCDKCSREKFGDAF